MISEKYENENTIFLNNVIKDAIIDPIRAKTKDNGFVTKIELFITASCNLSCEYCYLNKYEDLLYPPKINDRSVILNNLKLILDYLIANSINPTSLELFSGEIWHTSFGSEVLAIILDKYKIHPVSRNILIPTNMTFINDDIYISIMQNYIEEFKRIGVRLAFSASIDGKVIDEMTRPYDSMYVRTDEFYEKLFTFNKFNGFGFHPMVSAYSIEYWKENYLWFEEMCNKYCIDIKSGVMMLEVRNNDWTEDKISKYIEFVDWLYDHTYSKENPDSADIFIKDQFETDRIGMYNILALNSHFRKIECGYQERLTIRLGDLAVVPCHRLSYEQFVYGKFKVENNKISELTGINPELAFTLYSINPCTYNLKCNICKYAKLCLKQCLGAQYEVTGEILAPCNTVCNLFKAKIDLLIKKYDELGILERLPYIYTINAIELKSLIDELRGIG